jgi:hypothetical protein
MYQSLTNEARLDSSWRVLIAERWVTDVTRRDTCRRYLYVCNRCVRCSVQARALHAPAVLRPAGSPTRLRGTGEPCAVNRLKLVTLSPLSCRSLYWRTETSFFGCVASTTAQPRTP